AKWHHLAKENGKIKAIVGNFPLEMRVAEKMLKAYRIGTVSVHPYARSRGYMTVLMQNAILEARENDGDLMVLSGQRQRYEHFGFTCCGTTLCFEYNQSNKRHLQESYVEDIRLLPLEENTEYTRKCLHIYRKQSISAMRTEERFCEIAESWGGIPYVILRDGDFFGYCSLVKESGHLNECYLNDDTKMVSVILKLLEEVENTLTVWVAPHRTAAIAAMYLTCEESKIVDSPCFNVLHYPHVIEAFLSLKAENEGIVDGEYIIDVQEIGRYEIRVESGKVSVGETEKPFDISLNHQQMMCHLFSPMQQYLSLKDRSAVEKSWLPIPLYFPSMDNA
ncbi:MAG: GNAT family N-acetyltransferase, partial [Oscillospiraceae bacterium]